MPQHPINIWEDARAFMALGEQLANYMAQIFASNNIPQCHIRLTVSIDKNTSGSTFELCETCYFGTVVKGRDPLAVLDEFCRRNNWYQLNKPLTTKLISANPPTELDDIPF